ncbi:MAG TPA: WYL domain-containing transcriptional regulator, partial [Polyangia bacterium]
RFDHVIRVVRLVERLGESRAGLPLRAIADDLEVCDRTARRYLKALDAGGFCVESGGGRYRLARSAERGARLSPHEQRQLLMAALAAFPLGGTPLLPDMKAIVERFSQPSPRQQELFSRLRLPLSTPSRLAIDYRQHDALLATLLKALDERQVVHTTYYVPGRREETRRDLDPYAFYYEPILEALYLFAYCHLRQQMRTFAVHRFRKASLTRRVFRVAADFSVQGHLGGAFRVYRGKQTSEVVVRFAATVAPRLAERSLHASQRLVHRPDGALDLHLTIDGFEELESFVLSFGADALVITPRELMERVAWAHAEAAGQYAAARTGKADRGHEDLGGRVGRQER